MNRAIGSAGTALASALPAGSVLAHTGHQAHVHPGQGFVEALAHWLAGVMLWPGGALVALVGVAGLSAALVWSRRRRPATDRRD